MTGQGLGDFFDPLATRIQPGSIRRPPPGMIEGGPAPAPESAPGAPAVAAYGEQLVASLVEAFNRLSLLHGGIPAVEVPCGVWQVNAYLLGVANAILVDEPVRRNRRIVVVTNTHVANDIWVGPDSTTRVNFGEKIPAQGSRSFPFKELVRLYAISNAAGTVVAVSQVAS
jgi:hypothetical protein